MENLGGGGGGGGGGWKLLQEASFSLFYSPCLSFSFHFLGSQTPSEDDNSEDKRLKPFFLGVEGHWARDRRQLRVFPCFNGYIFYHLWFQSNVGFNPFGLL